LRRALIRLILGNSRGDILALWQRVNVWEVNSGALISEKCLEILHVFLVVVKWYNHVFTLAVDLVDAKDYLMRHGHGGFWIVRFCEGAFLLLIGRKLNHPVCWILIKEILRGVTWHRWGWFLLA
jgi:hypothetical protein